jgi:hypothetical protein
MTSMFGRKYLEFCDDLLGACPEYTTEIAAAKALAPKDQEAQYIEWVMEKTMRPELKNPEMVLPGVEISDAVWTALSVKSKKAILDYLRILDLMCFSAHTDLSGMGMNQEFVDEILKEWRGRLDRMDFKDLSDKFGTLFGAASGTLPPLPERFLKGKMAKLAEDMVKEFKPEDFGLTPEDIAACEKDPTRAFEILIGASTQKSENLQKVMVRVAKKLQAKMQSGEFRPQELAAEAEELMKEFQSHPAFVEMMGSFRDAFSFREPESARAAGRDGENRLSTVQARLRKKLEERKKKK